MRQRLLVLALLACAALLVAGLVFAPRFAPPRVLSGYVEGEALYMAAPVSGALRAANVQRGDRVSPGQPLFVVDPAQVDAQRGQAEAQIDAAQAQAEDARKGLRPVELAVYDANLAAAEARARDALAVLNRIRPLAAQGVYAKARLDDAQAAYDAAAAQAAAARRQRQAAELGAREGQVRAADAQVAQAQAGLTAVDARLADIAPKAPAAGRIEDVFYQPGEWVPANQPILALLPDDRIRLRFFVPEKSLSAYAPGRTVRFACDGCASGLTARITYISPRPEFTPPVIYSREARDRLVYLVEAQPSVRLNPGQPVDVTPLEFAKGGSAR